MKIKGMLATFSITAALLVGCSDDKKEDEVAKEATETEVFDNGAVNQEEHDGLTSIKEVVAKEKHVAEVTTEILTIEQIAKVQIVFEKGTKDDDKAKVIDQAMAELEEKFPNYKPNVITSEEK